MIVSYLIITYKTFSNAMMENNIKKLLRKWNFCLKTIQIMQVRLRRVSMIYHKFRVSLFQGTFVQCTRERKRSDGNDESNDLQEHD